LNALYWLHAAVRANAKAATIVGMPMLQRRT
jgi:hypothetical protein